MIWREITCYRYPYRVSDMGGFQRQHTDGTWRDISPSFDGKRAKVHVTTVAGVRKTVTLARIVYEAFHGSIPPGHDVVHKNRVKADCSAYNLAAVSHTACRSTPGNRRPVLKLDRNGEVVAIYKSVVEAAAKNHISTAAMGKRCLGRVKDPYRLDGYNYVYEEKRWRKKK